MGAWIDFGLATLSLPDHFWDGFGGAVTGAIVGGLLTALGGIGGALLIRWRDLAREKQRATLAFVASLRLVIDELSTNAAVVGKLLQSEQYLEDLTSIGLSDRTYQMVQVTLAQELRTDERFTVAAAYAPVRARETLFDAPRDNPGTRRSYRPRNLTALQDFASAIRNALGALEKRRV